MIKKIIIFILFCLVFTGRVYARETSALIINQIRGSESCCQPGNLNLINEIRDKKFTEKLSFGWALRYDAIKDKEYLKSLRDLGEFGLLLEITPDLAKESGVPYKGRKDGSDWYYGKNAFLIGYSIPERKQIIDTVFNSFKSEFGYYPSFTVSWMIDSWSLSYMNKTYNVRLHEITKEQYETDSYSLYGGVFNTPYYPSKNHPLIPGFDENKLGIVIVRQTVSDLLFNYGSSKAYYTSQPNDYLENPEKKDTSYFRNLLANSISQNSGFNLIVLGFENSFSWEKYGNEYLKQLDVISEMQQQGKIKVKKPTDLVFDFEESYQENKPFYLTKSFSPDSQYGVLWYFGKTYRARIIIKEGKVVIDDLRNFSLARDPYENNPVVSDYAYWIIPYLIDGSQQYDTLSKIQEKTIEMKGLLYGSTLSDNYTNPFGIVVNNNSFTLVENKDNLEIKFFGKDSGSLKFLPDSILFENSLNPYFNKNNDILFANLFSDKKEISLNFDKHFDFYLKPEIDEFKLGWMRENSFIPIFELTKKENFFGLTPVLNTNNIDILNPIFQPDRSDYAVDSKKSIYYWNNKKAIVNRNPVRLFILPLNVLGRATKVKEVKVTTQDSKSLKISLPEDYSYRVSPWFIDITSDEPIKTKATVIVDGVTVIKDESIEFAPNCKKNIGKCLTSWPQIIQYMIIILDEQRLKLISALKQLWKV